MIKNLLLTLPLTLMVLILYVSITNELAANIQHLFFLSATTLIVYTFQVSRNVNFTLARKVKWCILLLAVPSIFAIVYWLRHINTTNKV